MIPLATLLCNYGRGFCLIDIGTEGFVSGLEFAGGLVLIVGQFVGENTGELLGLGV